MAIKKEYINGELFLECETMEDWIEALDMNAPIKAPPELRVAALEAEVEELRRIAIEAIFCLRRREARRHNRALARVNVARRIKRPSKRRRALSRDRRRSRG